MTYFLVDFGATHVKWGAYCPASRELKALGERTFPEKDVIAIDEVRGLFDSIYDSAREIAGPFQKIFVCAQMHGFYLADIESEIPCSPYISWKDERCDILPEVDLSRTGLSPKKGLPVFNMQLFSGENRRFRFCTFNDILCSRSTHVSHDTLFCGTGFYDIISKKTIAHPQLEYNKVVSGAATVCGFHGCVPLYTALGDFQTAAYGAELAEGDVFVNLGTGSQVAVVSSTFREDCDNRPFNANTYLNCVTHIPSGRVLTHVLSFIGASFDDLAAVSLDGVLSSDVVFDLNLFESAYHFTDGGSISRLTLKNFNRQSLLCSLLRCYIRQYTDIIDNKFPPVGRILIAGGIPQKIPVIVQAFERRYGKVKLCCHDTLTGLANHINSFDL